METEKKEMPGKLAAKIIVPVAIVLVIAGIFSQKNSTGKETEVLEESSHAMPLAVDEVDLEELTSYGLPIVIDFGADSCAPCKEMAPVLQKLYEEWEGKVIVQFVDVWKNPSAAENFPLQVIPAQFFFTADGKPYVPSEEIGLEFLLYEDNDTQEHIYTTHQGGLNEEQLRNIVKEMGVE